MNLLCVTGTDELVKRNGVGISGLQRAIEFVTSKSYTCRAIEVEKIEYLVDCTIYSVRISFRLCLERRELSSELENTPSDLWLWTTLKIMAPQQSAK